MYVLGAGFSYGTNHEVKRGRMHLRMPLQNDLLAKIFQYEYRKISELDDLAKIIRKYFNPNGYRAKRSPGARRHDDIKNLSVEEIVTFFEEMARDSLSSEGAITFRDAEERLRLLALKLIAFLSLGGNPGTNPTLKSFRKLILTTDTIITFNWDTLLDRALTINRKRKWDPAWGYGKTVNDVFQYDGTPKKEAPSKHATLLKLHGSINWLASGNTYTISNDFSPLDRYQDVVMMPPKMLKQEIWGGKPTAIRTKPPIGNWAVHSKELYPRIWREAESSLATAKKIVFIGYSFPTADTSVFGLIRRSLAVAKAKYQEYPTIHLVDPNAARLAERFWDSFRVEIPIQNQFLSLHSYVTARDRK